MVRRDRPKAVQARERYNERSMIRLALNRGVPLASPTRRVSRWKLPESEGELTSAIRYPLRTGSHRDPDLNPRVTKNTNARLGERLPVSVKSTTG